MASSLPSSVVDSVKNLALNGSSNTNGDVAKIRNICCVGAGYVGKSPAQFSPVRCILPLV